MDIELSSPFPSRSSIAHKLLLAFKGNHPNFSTSHIAKTWSIPQSTLSRLENGQLKNIGIELFIKIIQLSGQGQNLKHYLSLTDANLVEIKSERFKHNLDTSIECGDLAGYYAKTDYFKLALIGTSEKSILTKDFVEKEFGKMGLKILEELIEKGVLKIQSNGKISQKNKITFPQKILKKTLLLATKECYDENKFGGEENWLSFQTENVNKEKMMKFVRKELQETYQRIKEALYSEEMSGKDTIFIGMVSDIINDSKRGQQ